MGYFSRSKYVKEFRFGCVFMIMLILRGKEFSYILKKDEFVSFLKIINGRWGSLEGWGIYEFVNKNI